MHVWLVRSGGLDWRSFGLILGPRTVVGWMLSHPGSADSIQGTKHRVHVQSPSMVLLLVLVLVPLSGPLSSLLSSSWQGPGGHGGGP